MRITFNLVTDGDGHYEVFKDHKPFGTLGWGTGATAGWYFTGLGAQNNSWIKVCDLDVDAERVLVLCRQMLETTQDPVQIAVAQAIADGSDPYMAGIRAKGEQDKAVARTNLLIQMAASEKMVAGEMRRTEAHEFLITVPPHAAVIAQLLYHSWHDIGFGCDWPMHKWLTGSERFIVSEPQMREIAEWVADNVSVWVVRMSSGYLCGADGSKDPRGLRSIFHWPTQTLAERSLREQCGGLGVVEQITVRKLLEACRE